jgi:protoporphyrinogen oxidase
MSEDVVILGGGPAGLTASYQLSKQGVSSTLVEKDAVVGGLARTVTHNGFRFDIGGHRFFTKIPEVQSVWRELLGHEFLTRPRLSRIYYRGRFFDYPLRPLNALRGLGPVDTSQVLLSYLWARAFPLREEQSFEQWVRNRFGWKLYSIFFKTYTEKVWGIPCSEIGAEWAAQRIQGLSLSRAVWHALFPRTGKGSPKTLIDQFEYPRLGPGQMWQRCREIVEERGHQILMEREVVQIRHANGRVTSVIVRDTEGRLEELPASQVISSLALSDVIRALQPAPPEAVLTAAERLRYRDFLTVALIVDQPSLFPDNWVYVHSPEVRLGRIQNFKNWSPDMVPDPDKSCLGLEYFVWEQNDLWRMSDEQLLELGTREMEHLRLVSRRDVSDGAVVRMRKAYPVYDSRFKESLRIVRAYLATLPNLQQVGRNGQHRYNNQDHSMLTAMLAVRNLLGEHHDIWDVNMESEYHETMERAQPRPLTEASRTSIPSAEAEAAGIRSH